MSSTKAMIRIRYTFNSASNGVSWNDFLSNYNTVEEALQSFAKIGPKFMLQNLIDMRLFYVDNTQMQSTENQIHGVEQEVAEFIAKQKG